MTSQSQPAPADSRARLLEVLGDCVHEALGLRQSLQDERLALGHQATDDLHAALTVKGVCVSRLKALDERRMAICEASGFSGGADQMQRMLDWCDRDSGLAARWLELQNIAAECNVLNQVNGAIIRLRRDMVDDSLAVLRGIDPVPGTYKREGRDSAANSQRSLAQA